MQGFSNFSGLFQVIMATPVRDLKGGGVQGEGGGNWGPLKDLPSAAIDRFDIPIGIGQIS